MAAGWATPAQSADGGLRTDTKETTQTAAAEDASVWHMTHTAPVVQSYYIDDTGRFDSFSTLA